MKIEFVASFPDIASAIQIGGGGDTRVKMDIPSTDLPQAVKLVLLTGKAFKVTIESMEQVKEKWQEQVDLKKI